MKCYLHTSDEVVAQCLSCSRGLCSDCSELFQTPICRGCAEDQNRGYRKTLMRQLMASGGIFLFILMCLAGDKKAHQPFVFDLIVAYAAASVPWGWSALNRRITPGFFLFMPVIGWLFYFGFKFHISGLIGFFIAPFKAYRAVKELRELNRQ